MSAIPSSRTRRTLFAAAMLVTCAACAALTGGSTYPATAPVRPAEDVPERFVSEDLAASAAVSDTLPGTGCRSPLIDPRDGTQLRMLNSQASVGDYEVPAGRYGVGRGEALRIECNSGRVVGIVPLRG